MVEAALSGQQWTIAAGGHEAVLVEVGGGLRTYRVAGAEITDGYAPDELCPAGAGQILAPWPNRIRDGQYTFQGDRHQLPLTEPTRHNAIHGLVNWSRWERTAGTADSVTLTLEMPAQPGYPWPLSLQSMWTVGSTGLRAEHTVTNRGASSCPLGFSVHPYLMVPGVPVDRLLLQVPARSRLLVDGRLLPIGAARVSSGEFDFTAPRRIGPIMMDTCFGEVIRDPAGGSAVVLSTEDGRGARIWADHRFGWWQLYTGDALAPERARHSVAVEPMTCPPDAFRSGRDLVVLEPGDSWQGSWGITPLPDRAAQDRPAADSVDRDRQPVGQD
jgi:aldose 1-epimerase